MHVRTAAEIFDDGERFRTGRTVTLLVIIVEALAVLLPEATSEAHGFTYIGRLKRGIAVPANIHPRQVGHLEGPHRETEIGEDIVDLFG